MNILRMIILAVLFLVLNVYLFIRGWQAMPDKTLVHIIYTTLFLTASTSMFIAVMAGNRLPLWLTCVFDIVGGYWMILFVFLFTSVLVADLLRLTNHFFNFFPQWVTDNWGQTKLIYLVSVFAFLTLISLIGFAIFASPRVRQLDITTEKSTFGGDSMTIVAASDIHLGNLIRRDRLTKWVDLINAQKPDLILLAGDVFDHNMRAVEAQEMYMELSRLDARFGVFAVPGNHDYYAGIDKAVAYLKKSGINVLRDEIVIIDSSLVIIGRDDMTNKKRKPLVSLMNGADTSLPVIVLDHQPASLNESAENNIDLHISGHTHNGQIFPYNRIVSRVYEVGYGYKKKGNTHVYVTSGLGLWGAPLRFGSRSEIVKVKLQVRAE